MKNNCPLCEADHSDPRWDQLWWSWQEDRERALREGESLGVSEEEIRRHMDKHRSAQPPHPKIWRANNYSAEGLSKREKEILFLLHRGAPLSSEDLALLLLGREKTDRVKIDKALRSLLSQQMVYRLFLEHLPGSGTRPRGTPALYLLGKSARVVFQKKLRKKKDWFESLDDFPSWRDPYRLWQKNSRAAEIFSASGLQLLPGGLLKEQSFLFHDPLLGKTRFRPEGCLLVSEAEQRFLIFLIRDKPMQPPERAIEEASRFAALQRSGALGGKPSLALLTTSDRQRGRQLLDLAQKTTFPEQTIVLLSPWSEVQGGDPRWRSLGHNQSGYLKDFLGWLGKKSSSESSRDKIEE